MTRRVSIAAMVAVCFLAATAQEPVKLTAPQPTQYVPIVSAGPTGYGTVPMWVQDANSFLTKGKAVNGQCPVCGFMAKSWHRPTEKEYFGSGVCLSPSDGSTTFGACVAPSETKLYGDTEKIVRCKRCNAAFWQDAEEPKK